MNDFWNMAWLIFAGLLPFLGFLVVCYVVMRAVFNADRNERKAMAEWERSQGKAANSGPTSTGSTASGSAATGIVPGGSRSTDQSRPSPGRGEESQ